MSKYLEFDTPATSQSADLRSEFGLKNHGLVHLDRVFWNLPAAALYEEATFRKEGCVAAGGPLVVKTGKWTARAAQDKYVVKESSTEDKIWWGEYNRPFSPEKFDALFARVQAYLQDEELFVQDCYVGADPEFRMPIRIITEKAWQSLFARNMFINIQGQDELKRHVPEFTVLAATGFKADPRIDGTRTETAIIINFARRLALICNTQYGGEIKKSIFTVLNFLLPLREVLTMHCSANVGKDGDVALFFGLSGTGKTTLSADPRRRLIGDDEHGWSDNGVFNFEGGCYAKVIRLSKEHEPEIHACTHRFGTVLENVAFDRTTRHIDLDDDILTENTRAAYPLRFIDNVVPEGHARSHPKNVILLTCDA
ncbi:MAG: phosphoenolpyruvate carboxykinase (ATP), partial [Polyangiaceae bacterium]|nr:phosphoenolpyruvate carboxykinase (ATP) [Polyangiaceae bacterium]